ncbi:MAG: AraC family transcriptional regulator [Treponema sp.]|jgi:AraC-like DNA-binding protein/ligand-binding sensor protein|nr:AraC family transcriptional regulator [Treponema sp.]
MQRSQEDPSSSVQNGGKVFKNNPPPSSVISRREIEPLLLKAAEVLKSYEEATGTVVSVLDLSGHSVHEPRYDRILHFCTLCKKYYSDKERNWECDEYPCTGMHINSISEAWHSGGIFIFMCDLGFMFWTSPLTSNGRSVGALMAGGVMGIERQQIFQSIAAKFGGAVSKEEIENLLLEIKEKTFDEIKALAQTLLLCAEQVSHLPGDYYDTVKQIAEQEDYLSSQIHLIRNRGNGSPPSYPIDKERLLLASLRRGDNEEGRKILTELLEHILISNNHNFEYMKLRAIELVVLLSRAAITPDSSEDQQILETNNRYLKRIQDSKNLKELTDILHLIMDRMASKIFSFQGIRHASALRKAERFIWDNYTRKISLKEIADASGLSAPYFSSVFKEEMGENLSNYLNRLRIEKATNMLNESDIPLNAIAASCGFEDQSWFSKIFKYYTGISPGKYRNIRTDDVMDTDTRQTNAAGTKDTPGGAPYGKTKGTLSAASWSRQSGTGKGYPGDTDPVNENPKSEEIC